MGNIRSVLFVCTGNSCRSVMAEALLKKRLSEMGKQGIVVRSAGVRAADKGCPTGETVKVTGEEGVDLSGFESTHLTNDMIKEYDLILAMESAHKNEIIRRVPEAAGKTFLLSEYAQTDAAIGPLDREIPDPIGGPIEEYRRCMNLIKNDIERVANSL